MKASSLLIAVLFAFAALFSSVVCHSWVTCTDYRIDSQADADYYNPSKCHAYPRNWFEQVPINGGVFGQDSGYEYFSSESRACKYPSSSEGYTGSYPMARYRPGQKVCLAYPAKNHVAATCTNQYIPDNGLQIYVSGPNPSSDPTQSQFKQNLVADLSGHQNGVIDFKGYQNCPKFCENMDKALCTQCFNIPRNLQVGSVYSFQWYWQFNLGTAPYTTCWEALIVDGDSDDTVPVPEPVPQPDDNQQTPEPTTAEEEEEEQAPAATTTTTGTQEEEAQEEAEEQPAPAPPTATESLSMAQVPRSIPKNAGASFQVTVEYKTAEERQLVVDVLNRSDWSWYGKGIVRVNGQGTTTITVTLVNEITEAGDYVLAASMTGNPTVQQLARVSTA